MAGHSRFSRREIVWLGLFSTLPLGGCGGSHTGPPRLGDAADWSATLDFRVGSRDDPEYALTDFRRLEVGRDGRIYTFHTMESLVRVFSPDGRLLDSFGGRGEGPGELGRISTTGWMGDTLWIRETVSRRFSLFGEDGGFVRSFSVPFVVPDDMDEPNPPRAVGLLFDGGIYGHAPILAHQLESGVLTAQVLVRLTEGGEIVDTIGSVPLVNFQWVVSNRVRPGALARYERQPFGDGPLWGFVPGEPALWVLERSAPAAPAGGILGLQKVGFSGDTVLSRGYGYTPHPISNQEVDSVLDLAMADLAEGTGRSGGELRGEKEWARTTLFSPPFRTPVSDLVAARDGGVWLRGNRTGFRAVPWFYFDSEGSLLGQVQLPGRLSVLQGQRSTLWGVEHDELDVPYLVRYSVHGQDPGPGGG